MYLCINRTCQASQRCSNRQVVFYMTRPFNKTYFTPRQHVKLLQERGLLISDELKAESYISNIGYFRLTAYLYPLLEYPKTDHRFKTAATFQKALDMYRFDRKLRIILLNEIEKIEVAVRSKIVNTVADITGDIFWISNLANFAKHARFLSSIAAIDSELKKSKEDFIIHFYKTYSDKYPPAWMIAEILPLGTLTHVYSNLKDNAIRKKIASEFGLAHKVLESWLIVLYGLRNMCCHHSRTWNRELAIITMEPKTVGYKWIDLSGVDKRRLYYRICMIRYFLFSISPCNSLKERLVSLFDEFPSIDISAMGFPVNWVNDLFWAD